MIRFVRRHLDASSRMSELLFGVVMTLTFTLGAGLVIKEGPDATRELLIGVIGCNVAWGIIDGLLYIFGCMHERGLPYRASVLMARQGAAAAEARLDAHLEDTYGPALSPETCTVVRKELVAHLGRSVPPPVRMTREDVLGAVVVFLLVTLTSVPAVLPFLFLDQHMLALRVSNLLLVGFIFLIGWRWASEINANRWRIALGMAAGGLVLVQLTIMLGG